MNKYLKYALLLSFMLTNQISLSAPKFNTSVIPINSSQMVLVISANWDDLHARMYLCEKNKAKWCVQKSFPAVCGRKGMAWGIGMYPENSEGDLTPVKKEGDLKSPVGVFQFGECMGYSPGIAANPNFKYRQLTDSIQGVDDLNSQYYNRIVDTTDFKDKTKVDWKSYEKMKRNDDLYKWLIVIKHNPGNTPGAGSLIFLHLWKNENSGTAGCTAIAEENMLEILKWLNTGKNPVFVQLPSEIYRRQFVDWGLPTVDTLI